MRALVIFALLLVLTIYNCVVKDKVNWQIAKYLYADYVGGTHVLPNQPYNLLLGSSTLANLNVDNYLRCQPWLNRGIGSAKISDISDYVRLANLHDHVSYVVVYMGENDISDNMSVDLVKQQFLALLQTFKHRFRQATIVVLAIKYAPARQDSWADFEEFNHYLQTLADQDERVRLIQVAEKSQQVGLFTGDNLHFNHRGYDLFTRQVNALCHS